MTIPGARTAWAPIEGVRSAIGGAAAYHGGRPQQPLHSICCSSRVVLGETVLHATSLYDILITGSVTAGIGRRRQLVAMAGKPRRPNLKQQPALTMHMPAACVCEFGLCYVRPWITTSWRALFTARSAN